MFNGQLNSNEIFGALYNMIISVQAFGDNIADTNSTLVDKFRVDGSLYGDTKLYVATDVLASTPWGVIPTDSEGNRTGPAVYDNNILATHRPTEPITQAITLDTFRQIALTVDDYMSKRAWGSEGAFAQFNNVLMGWIGDTKRIYDSTLMNVYVGTTETAEGSQTQTITVPQANASGADAEADNRIFAQTVANKVANIMTELTDVSRDYNDLGFMRSYRPEDLVIVWNADYYNKITKMDLPTIFHKDGLFDKLDTVILPGKYFGKAPTQGGTVGGGAIVRAKAEGDFMAMGETKHYFPGELLPAATAYTTTNAYLEDQTVVCKILHKNSVPYMSAFEVGTSFFNPKALNTNHYLTFGHNTLEYLANYPFITVKAIEA